MLRTALRNVLAHKGRLLMTVLAVMLGVAFVSGTLVFTSTVSDAYQKSAEKGYSHVDVAIRPDSSDDKNRPGAAPDVSADTLRKAAELPGTDSATGVVSGFAALADKNGDLVGQGWSTKGGNYYTGPDGDSPDSRYPMRHGRAPRTSHEVALDAKTAERTGYAVGDTVRMSVNGPVRREKVVGVFTTEDGAVAAGGTLVLFDNATAQQLFSSPGHYSRIQLKAADGTSQRALKAQVEKILPDAAEAVTGQKLADKQSETVSASMSGIKTAMLAFAGIALFVGIFIIANTFSMLVAQRTKELALLRAVGASRRQVTRSVLAEAVTVGAVAAVAGFAAGLGIAVGLRAILGSSLPDGPLIITPTAIVASLVVGVVVTVLAAWLPARRAAKVPPIAAMNSVHAVATTRSLLVRNTIGALLAAGGAVLVLAATSMDDGEAAMGGGAALLMVGVFVLTPLLSRPLIAVAAPVLRLFGVAGRLSRQNAVRNPRRTAATASALMIGLTLITGLTVIASGVQKGIEKMATEAVSADYTVSMANYLPLAPDVAKKLDALDETTAVSPLRISPSRIDGDKEFITGVNGSSIGQVVSLDFSAGSWKGVSDGHSVVVDGKTAKKHHWKVGSDLKVTYADGKKGTLTVAGVYDGNVMINGIMLDTSAITPHMAHPRDMQVMVKTKDGVSEKAENTLQKALGNNPAILVQDDQDISDGIAKAIGFLLNTLYALLAMAVIVAVLGVVNTLAMSVFERGQEIGMLRAIGLDRRRTKRMVRLESLVISLYGGVLGIGLGIFLAWAAGQLIEEGLASYTMVLPWGRLGIFLVMAAVVGILAALWPARRAARLNMLAAIKTE